MRTRPPNARFERVRTVLLMLVAFALLAGVAGCIGGDASTDDAADGDAPIGQAVQAITNGAADDDDPAVVALLLEGDVFCTGVLVTPYVVVTAAHCLAASPPDQVFFGGDPNDDGKYIAVTEARLHPDFDEDTLANDIGVIGSSKRAPREARRPPRQRVQRLVPPARHPPRWIRSHQAR